MITIGYCTRVSDENHGKHLIKSCGLSPKKIQIIEIVNTGNRSLTNCYNEILKKAEHKHVVFCHSDITIETKQWGNKLLRLFERNPDFGIIGVAGTKFLSTSGQWWENRKKMYGRVAHTHEGKTWLTSYSSDLGQDLEEVVTVDGVFFAVDKSKLKTGFNQSVEGFHFYDVTFCFENFLKGVKIGVTTFIRVNHKSIGMTNQQWEDNRKQFSETFKDNLPVSLKKTLRNGEVLNIMLTALSFNDESSKSPLILEIAEKLIKAKHKVTICANVGGKIPILAKHKGIDLAPIQQPPGFMLGDGKWKLNTAEGQVESKPNVLYKIKDASFDVIHIFDDEIIDHMNKLYNGTSLINTKAPNGLFLMNTQNPLTTATIEISNDIKDVEAMDVHNIINQYVESI